MSKDNEAYEKIIKIKFKLDQMHLHDYLSIMMSSKIKSDGPGSIDADALVKFTESALAFIKFNMCAGRLIHLCNFSAVDKLQLESCLHSDVNEPLEDKLSKLLEEIERVQTPDEAINILYENENVSEQLRTIVHNFVADHRSLNRKAQS